MINTVIYDFDGTIMNTNDVVAESWKHTYRTIYGQEMPAEEIRKTFGEPIMTSMKRVFPHMDPDEAVKIYREFQEAHKAELVKLFPGMDALMKKVTELGYKTAIVTSRFRNSLVDYLSTFGLLDYAQVLVTCDDTKVHKPNPEPILIALEKLGSKAEESIMIGDSMFDILCAKNAGCPSALVSWAVAVTEEDIQGENAPEYFMEKPEDLLEILK
ncbi:MAG: HAD-IA family hydrolase [Clostridia bacterium]|nr:HAD-IA family hydrolase [Clostridia bacterium]